MAQRTRYRARWLKDKPGHAKLALEVDGLVFIGSLRPDALIPSGMVEALCDVTVMAVRHWVEKGKLKVIQKTRGRSMYRVSDVYVIAKERGVVE